MTPLYPPIEPYARHRLAVTPLHELYIEESGNPKGRPVVFLHGGPGAGCEDYHRRFFDPEGYRIILFDQRGAGRSAPHAELSENTTQDLVADIERIRAYLLVDRWLVFGGSWGSTLALVYAQTHPAPVAGLIVRGIFLCRPQEIQWFYQIGASLVFPDYWEAFVAPIPEAERQDMVSAYYRRLTGPDRLEQERCARAWSLWEGRTANLLPKKEVVDFFSKHHTATALARIECHYFMHNSFLRPNQILADGAKLAGIPTIIVHGRYDLICPLDSAWALHKAHPESRLVIVPGAGHSASEPGIARALIEASCDFLKEAPWQPTS